MDRLLRCGKFAFKDSGQRNQRCNPTHGSSQAILRSRGICLIIIVVRQPLSIFFCNPAFCRFAGYKGGKFHHNKNR